MKINHVEKIVSGVCFRISFSANWFIVLFVCIEGRGIDEGRKAKNVNYDIFFFWKRFKRGERKKKTKKPVQ